MLQSKGFIIGVIIGALISLLLFALAVNFKKITISADVTQEQEDVLRELERIDPDRYAVCEPHYRDIMQFVNEIQADGNVTSDEQRALENRINNLPAECRDLLLRLVAIILGRESR